MSTPRPEPAELVDTAGLLAQVREFSCRYIVLPGDHFHDAVALWVLHAHAVKAADTSGRLVFKSPEKESGKTRALEVLEALTPAPLNAFNATVPAIFRLLEEEQATLLFDEVDAIFSPKAAKEHEDVRALLNAGYRRGATVARVAGQGSKMYVKRFPVFAATALAAIGNLPDTIESRAIVVPMRRRAPNESVAQFRRREVESEAGDLRDALSAWAAAYIEQLAEARPEIPERVTDRAADIWEPLLAIADLAGGEWPARGRNAAIELVAGRVDEDQSEGVRLLADTRTAFGDLDRLPSGTLLSKLNGLDESGWGAWHDGKGMSPRDLARILKRYGIKPKNVRLPDATVPKGYLREDFADAWARYLRDGESATGTEPDGESATGATSRYTDSYSKTGFVADVTDVEGERGREVSKSNGPKEDQLAPAHTPKNPLHRYVEYKPVADVAADGPPGAGFDPVSVETDEEGELV